MKREPSLLENFFRFSRLLVWIGGAFLILSAFMVTADVFSRKLFSVTLAGSDEISGYIFGVSTSFALAFTLIERANIRVDALYSRFPSWLRRFGDFIALIMLISFIGFIAYNGWEPPIGFLGERLAVGDSDADSLGNPPGTLDVRIPPVPGRRGHSARQRRKVCLCRRSKPAERSHRHQDDRRADRRRDGITLFTN